MAGKARVSALAKELGVPAKAVLAKLQEMGEYVKSASSTIEEPVERQLRAALADAADVSSPAKGQRSYPPNPYGLGQPATADGYPRDIPYRARQPLADPLGVAPMRRRREWHRGGQPSSLTRLILDRVVVPRRGDRITAPPPQFRYFADEVREAEQISSEWSEALFEGMTQDDVISWLRFCETPIKASEAIELNQAGIGPDDIGWSYADRGKPPLGDRLAWGNIKTSELILEVQRRRAAGESA